MALTKCNYCGKPFNSFGSPMCKDCMQLVDEAYVKVRKFIYRNPDKADFSTIVEETETPEKVLSYLINQGRIVVENGSGRGIRCRACGAETTSGVLCESCKRKLIAEKLLQAAPQPEQTEGKPAGSKAQPLQYNQNVE